MTAADAIKLMPRSNTWIKGSIPKRPIAKAGPTIELIMQQKIKTAHRVDQNGSRVCLKRPMTQAKTDHDQNVPSQ